MAFKVNYKRDCGKYTQMNFTTNEIMLLYVHLRDVVEDSRHRIKPLYVEMIIKEVIQDMYDKTPKDFNKFGFLLALTTYFKWTLDVQHFDTIYDSILEKLDKKIMRSIESM